MASKWLRALALGLVAVLPLGLGVSACSSNQKVSKTFTVAGTTVSVEATITGGDIIATPAPDNLPNLQTVKALATPLHLEVKGGQLEGKATLTFPVDQTKLGGADPEAWATVLMRSERTANKWVAVGGDYDPAKKTISVETEGFSYWSYGVTDFAKMQADIAWSKDRSISARLGRTLFGSIPPLTCSNSAGQIGLTYAVKDDSAPPPVAICYTLEENISGYYLEIVNPHPFPFLLTLPKGLTAKRELLKGNGALSDGYALAQLLLGSRALLPAEDKLVLTAKKADFDALPELPVIKGVLDQSGLAVDVVSFLLDRLALDYEESIAQLNNAATGLGDLYERVLKDKATADCADAALDKLGTTDPMEMARMVMLDCYDSTVEPLLTYLEQQTRAGGKSAAAQLKRFARRVTIVAELPQYVKEFRQFGGALVVHAETSNKVGNRTLEISLLGKLPYQELFHVLPDQAQRREYGYMNPFAQLMPFSCAAGGGEFALETRSGGIRYASGHYSVEGGTLLVQLFKVTANPQAANSYLTGMKDRCQATYPDGSPTNPRYEHVARGQEGEVQRVYREIWGAGVKERLHSLSYSNGYLLVMNFDGSPDRFGTVRQRVNQSIDRYLVTTFSK